MSSESHQRIQQKASPKSNFDVYSPMKRRVCSLIGAFGIATLVGCSTPQGITTINVIGPEGSHVAGYYVQDGRQVPVTATLPLSFSHDGLSELELRKESLAEPLTLAAQKDDHGWHSEIIAQAGEGVSGLHLRAVRNGLTAEVIK
jgi:hypothetical protein